MRDHKIVNDPVVSRELIASKLGLDAKVLVVPQRRLGYVSGPVNDLCLERLDLVSRIDHLARRVRLVLGPPRRFIFDLRAGQLSQRVSHVQPDELVHLL